MVAYLSGLRPAELLHLQPGCCPVPADDGTGPVRYRLHGVKFKAARNDDGTPASDGEARQWTVIPPVHTAIGILEQLTATSHLFPLRPHWLNGAPRPPRRPEPSPGISRGRRHRTGQVIIVLPGALGKTMRDGELIPGPGACLGTQTFDQWLAAVGAAGARR